MIVYGLLDVLKKGNQEANLFGASQLGTEHLLLALLTLPTVPSVAILNKLQVNYESIKVLVANELKGKSAECNQRGLLLDEHTEHVLKLAQKEAEDLESASINADHLVLAICGERKCTAAKLLEKMDLDLSKVSALIREYLSKAIKPSNKLSQPAKLSRSEESRLRLEIQGWMARIVMAQQAGRLDLVEQATEKRTLLEEELRLLGQQDDDK